MPKFALPPKPFFVISFEIWKFLWTKYLPMIGENVNLESNWNIKKKISTINFWIREFGNFKESANWSPIIILDIWKCVALGNLIGASSDSRASIQWRAKNWELSSGSIICITTDSKNPLLLEKLEHGLYSSFIPDKYPI